jgi:predicted small secreted protein
VHHTWMTPQRVPLVALAALAILLVGCNTSSLAGPNIKSVLDQKGFTVIVSGSSRYLTFPEVLSRYNPEKGRLLMGMIVDRDGPEATEVEVIEKVAFDTYVVAYRTVKPVELEGDTLQPTLQLRVDTATSQVEPLNEEAQQYFAIEGRSFGGN